MKTIYKVFKKPNIQLDFVLLHFKPNKLRPMFSNLILYNFNTNVN